MEKITTVQIFFSSPGDVEPEKKIAKEIAEELSINVGQRLGIRLELKEWRSHVTPQFGPRIQSLVNEQIGDYDIYICLFWMRFGSPTGRKNPLTNTEFLSGTEEEFFLAQELWKESGIPNMNLFFKRQRAAKSLTESEQATLVHRFRENQMKNGWTLDFRNRDEYRKGLNKIFTKAIFDAQIQSQTESKLELLEEIDPKFLYSEQADFQKLSHHITRRVLSLENKGKLDAFLVGSPHQTTLEEALEKTKRIVLLGNAGSGKSTEVRRLANILSKEESRLIPVFKRLHQYVQEDLEEFLPDGWDKVPKGQLVVILDGLDEIQSQHFNSAIRKIEAFADKYPDTRIVISSRTNFYKFPTNNSSGTLSGFGIFFLMDLVNTELKEFIEGKHHIDFHSFIESAESNNYQDLLAIPFFVDLLANVFKEDARLTSDRLRVYELLISSRIELDVNKFRTTVALEEKRHELIKVLERIAVTMELIGQNSISTQQLTEFTSSEERILLKYSTGFQRKDEEEIWEFEHRNIQEYLAARSIVGSSYENVLKLISFEPEYNVLNPSWLNTLAFLISLLDSNSKLGKSLINWLLENEKEAIVRLENEKIDKSTRVQLFQLIFNDYKSKGIWIESNKFSDSELSQFGQSEENFYFLIDQIQNQENQPVCKANAVILLSHFTLSPKERDEASEALISFIINAETIPNHAHIGMRALKRAKLNTKVNIDRVLEAIGERLNQNIRAGIYDLILESEFLNDYVDVFIDGIKIKDVEQHPDRENVSLADEGWSLGEGLQRFTSLEAIQKILSLYIQRDFGNWYYENDILKSTLNNALDYLTEPEEIVPTIKTLLNANHYLVDEYQFGLLRDFLDSIGKRNETFVEFYFKRDELDNWHLLLASLGDKSELQFIIGRYLQKELGEEDIIKFLNCLYWRNKELAPDFELIIRNKTDIDLPQRENIDYDQIRKARRQMSLNLLFDFDGLKQEVLQVFEYWQKDSLTFEDLYNYNSESKDIESEFSEVSLDVLRDLSRKKENVTKAKFLNFFSTKNKTEWYRINKIHTYMKRYETIEVNANQTSVIEDWCNRNFDLAKFTDAFTYKDSKSFSVSQFAILIWFFTHKLNINFNKERMLDMLSFDWDYGRGEDADSAYIRLLQNIEPGEIKKRMLENLEEGIKNNQVFMRHVVYCCNNKIMESYPFIRNSILDTDRDFYRREETLKIYWDATSDEEGLLELLENSDLKMSWKILDRLITTDNKSFLIDYLNKYLVTAKGEETDLKAAELLMSLDQLYGLEYFVDWAQKNERLIRGDLMNFECLSSLTQIEAFSYLLELLKLTYGEHIRSLGVFDRFSDHVRSSVFGFALKSDKHFAFFTKAINEFIEQNNGKLEHVNFLHQNVIRTTQNFYLEKSRSLSINQVKDRLKTLGNV